MEFLLYLTPEAKDILNQVYRAKFSVTENSYFCRENTTLFGYSDFGNKFVICTQNIKRSGEDVKFYVNQTVAHEAVHVGHLCNGFRPFGISLSDMPLPSNKLEDVKNSTKTSYASYRIEYEAHWMENKPEKVKYVIQKYCF